ncbi:MAG TPA: SGNH/GDSL hydrolase family protein [Hyphomicrobiaceae bacterium]|jgi:lysophospholipase L1-like esterase|nr:SGNH/GDSL hydrolase family protein [Hyphomicrobiaceae bacterium]
MARAAKVAGLIGVGILLAATQLASGPAALGQTDTQLPTVSKECGEIAAAATPLPHGAAALRDRKQLRILAIGASSASMLGGTRDTMPLLEQILERSIKGLDVEIINRGVSGELAAAAAERLKIEVALNHPDVILWQVGTNDAFAQVPVEEFETTVKDMLQWLRKHNVDAILIGLHYMKQLATHEHYQAIRASLRRIVAAEGVLRIGRYESSEILARTMREEGHPEPSTFGLTDVGYNCMAQYLARAIAVGLFAKPPAKTAP